MWWPRGPLGVNILSYKTILDKARLQLWALIWLNNWYSTNVVHLPNWTLLTHHWKPYIQILLCVLTWTSFFKPNGLPNFRASTNSNMAWLCSQNYFTQTTKWVQKFHSYSNTIQYISCSQASIKSQRFDPQITFTTN